ncbi:MAG: DUF1059 domain-containing protein [Actinomycetota bacterium]|nr:DUF1059 domain-containing protein [Actinomycetota bacterium]
MKRFRVHGPRLRLTVESETEEQILEIVDEHGRDVHGMAEVPPEIQDRVRSRIVDQRADSSLNLGQE